MNRTSSNAAAADMRNVVSDVENLLNSVGTAAGGTVHEFKAKVGSALEAAKARLDAIDGSVRSGARRAVYTTDDYAHAHPWQALGAGMLIGAAIGFLLASRR